MSVSTGFTGRGVAFQVGDDNSPVAWTTIGNATGINLSGQNAEEIDFTHLLSEGGFREFRQGFKDGGTVSVTYHFDPDNSSHATLRTDFLSGRVFEWRINYTEAGIAKGIQGEGFVQNSGDIDHNVDGPVTGTATIRISGGSTVVNIP